MTQVLPIDPSQADPPGLPGGTRPRRYGGDKLGFEAADDDPTGSLCHADPTTINAIAQCIDDYRAEKVGRKREIERWKEHHVQAARSVAGKKRVLKWYHYAVLQNAGWSWTTLSGLIEQAATNRVRIEEVRSGPESGHAFIRCADRSHLLYKVYFGDSRFPVEPTMAPSATILPPQLEGLPEVTLRNIYVKLGYSRYTSLRQKHFVLDSNGVMTHRYVTRAFLVYNLATMFGLRLTGPGTEPDVRDAELLPYLQPATALRICRTTTRLDEPTVTPVPGLSDQLARYTDPGFGGHADVFDIRRAASYEPDGQLNPDFTPYRSRGSTGSRFMPRIGYTLTTGFCESRVAGDPMMRNERASMQVRNGSGLDQPYLSTAAMLHDYKVIRANKGERFDDSAENLGVVLLDLSIAKLMGVEIINQHAVESDRFKTAYDRYFDKGDIAMLQRKVATTLVDLAKRQAWAPVVATVRGNSQQNANAVEPLFQQLSAAILGRQRVPGLLEQIAGLIVDSGVTPAGIGVVDGDLQDLITRGRRDAVDHIMRLRGDQFDHKTVIKRDAASELEEYIASGRKNREILLNRIPLACVVGIRLNTDNSKWADLDRQDHPTLYRAITDKRWIEVDQRVRGELSHYVAGDAQRDYARLKRMFQWAVTLKREEDLSGAKDVT